MISSAVVARVEQEPRGDRDAAAVVHPGRCLARQRRAQRRDDGRLRHAQHRGLAPIDRQLGARRGLGMRDVDVDDARRGGKLAALPIPAAFRSAVTRLAGGD